MAGSCTELACNTQTWAVDAHVGNLNLETSQLIACNKPPIKNHAYPEERTRAPAIQIAGQLPRAVQPRTEQLIGGLETFPQLELQHNSHMSAIFSLHIETDIT